MPRTIGIIFGVAVHLCFGVTVWHLFWFLKGDAAAVSADDRLFGSLVTDAALACVFAVPHSLLLMPDVRRSIVA